MPLPYESTDEDEAHITSVRNWLERDRENNISRTISVNCILLYASSIATFLKERDIYTSVYLEEVWFLSNMDTTEFLGKNTNNCRTLCKYLIHVSL